MLFTGQTVGVAEAFWLLFLSYLFVLVGMMAVVSLAVALSTLTDSGLTAMAAGLVLVIIMLILGSLSVFDFLRALSLHEPFLRLDQLLQRSHRVGAHPRRAHQLRRLDVGMTGIAWLIFRRKDIRS